MPNTIAPCPVFFIDGVNVISYFTGESKGAPHEALFWRWEAQAAVREGKWKLLVGGKRSYLYDLEVDPEEKHSQLAQQPELAKRLRTKLEAWAAELQPPGINLRPMAKTWEEYYDFYLDGKPAPEPSDAKEEDEGDRKAKKRKMKKATEPKEASKAAASSAADLFELRDVNKDGKVTLAEVLNGRTGPTVPGLEKRFKSYDSDGDEVWTRSELQSASKPKGTNQ